jgi:hypothetical protein
MTPEETAGILSMITAAYPHVYKNLAEDEAKAVVMIWAVQFKDVPADIVFMATNKAIATSKYPPTIADVKAKLSSLYWEAYDIVNNNEALKIPGRIEKYKWIMEVTQDAKFRAAAEPTIDSMIGWSERYLLNGEEEEHGEP